MARSTRSHVLGQTQWADFPTTPDAIQRKCAGPRRDLFGAEVAAAAAGAAHIASKRIILLRFQPPAAGPVGFNAEDAQSPSGRVAPDYGTFPMAAVETAFLETGRSH